MADFDFIPARDSTLQKLKNAINASAARIGGEDYAAPAVTVPKVDTISDATLQGVIQSVSAHSDAIGKYIPKGEPLTQSAASGEMITLDDAAGMTVKSAITQITPVQAGEGDPSPENVRPISGFTGATIKRAGKNLVRYNVGPIIERYGVRLVVNADGSITLNGVTSENNSFWNLNYVNTRTKAFPVDVPLVLSGGNNLAVLQGFKTKAGSWDGVRVADSTGGDVPFTIDRGADGNYIRIRVARKGTVLENVTVRPMVRPAAFQDGTFAPYKGTDYSIDFVDGDGQPVTVYGGTLDWGTGRLITRPYYASYQGESLTGRWISSMDVYHEGGTPTIGAQVVDLDGTGEIYQLTPQQIELLRGDNTIISTGGSTEITYGVDDIIMILRRIEALENT